MKPILITTVLTGLLLGCGTTQKSRSQMPEGPLMQRQISDEELRAISDLHLAAKYSSSDLVGKGSEFVFLQEKDLTIRRDLGNSEVESGTLAGGTLLIKSELMREVNGWRELNRGVDVALIKDAQLAGCRMWRTHPFGYLLRRTSGQHTWEADDKYFLRQSEQKWDGIATDLVGVIDN